MPVYRIESIDDKGKSLPPHEMFMAWVQMAESLSKQLPDGPCRQLCEAVFEAVTNDQESGDAGKRGVA